MAAQMALPSARNVAFAAAGSALVVVGAAVEAGAVVVAVPLSLEEQAPSRAVAASAVAMMRVWARVTMVHGLSAPRRPSLSQEGRPAHLAATRRRCRSRRSRWAC